MTLNDRIINGETELQLAYKLYREEMSALHDVIDSAEKRVVELKDKINTCRQRAQDQGYPNLLT